MSFLEDILAAKRREVEQLRKDGGAALAERRAASAPAVRSCRPLLAKGGRHVIAEVKRASPSRGLLSEGLDPAQTARSYEQSGASAISVLTDSGFFRGSGHDLVTAREAVSVPVLRKDFIIDQLQVAESRALGADIILLIVRIVTDVQLRMLMEHAASLGMLSLVEVHTADEARRAVDAGASMVGINNRDLDTFSVSLEHGLRVRESLPTSLYAVGESGITTVEDARTLFAAGFDALLIGEGLTRSSDAPAFLADIRRPDHAGPVH